MKNNLKRVFSLVLVFMLCITFIPMTTASAKTFKDVPKTNWAYNYINEMSNKGYIQGYPNGTFKPGKDISFLEAMRFAAILTQYDENALQAAKQVWQSQVVALGVPKWAQDNVIKCLAKGAVSMKTLQSAKKNKMFTTNRPVSRVNLAEFFAGAMGVKSTDPVIALPFKDVKDIPEGSRAAVAGLIDAGVVSEKGTGKGMFYPRRAVRRDQVARMVYSALKYQEGNTSNASPVNPTYPVNPTNPTNPVTPVNPTPTVVTGTIKEIAVTGITAIMMVDDNTTNGKVFSLDGTTVITVDGSIGNLSSLLVGQNVTVTASSAVGVMQAKSINAKGVQFSLEGEVSNVDTSNKEIKITYTDSSKNKVSKVFKVDSSSTITINNKTRDLIDVKRGSQVKATIYNDKVKTLDVTASSDDYKGYIKKLSYREITIVSLNGRENTYKLPSSERDYDIYDSRESSRRSYRERKLSFNELSALGNVYVEIETDSRYDDEVDSIDVGDGFDNEYIVYRNNDRGRSSSQYKIEVYPKGSNNSYRDRETYYYDSDLRADSFNSRRDVRVRDIGEGSRIVILDKDSDTIKKLMVIDTKDNSGYSYGNWIYAKVDTKDSNYFWLKKDSDGTYVKVSYGSINSSYVYTDKPYWFEIKNGVLQSRPRDSKPDDYYYNRSGYKTVRVYQTNIRANKIYLYESSNDSGYYIDSDTTIETDYTFSELTRKDESFFKYADIRIIADKYGHVDRLYIR